MRFQPPERRIWASAWQDKQWSVLWTNWSAVPPCPDGHLLPLLSGWEAAGYPAIWEFGFLHASRWRLENAGLMNGIFHLWLESLGEVNLCYSPLPGHSLELLLLLYSCPFLFSPMGLSSALGTPQTPTDPAVSQVPHPQGGQYRLISHSGSRQKGLWPDPTVSLHMSPVTSESTALPWPSATNLLPSLQKPPNV